MAKLIPTKTEKSWNGLYNLANDEHSVTEEGRGNSLCVAKGGEKERTYDFLRTKRRIWKTKISERTGPILSLKRKKTSTLFCGTYRRRPHWKQQRNSVGVNTPFCYFYSSTFFPKKTFRLITLCPSGRKKKIRNPTLRSAQHLSWFLRTTGSLHPRIRTAAKC